MIKWILIAALLIGMVMGQVLANAIFWDEENNDRARRNLRRGDD